MYSPLEAASNSGIELPGDICRTQHQNALAVVAHTIHLYENFRLYSAGGFRLPFASGSTESVDFVNEYDRRFILSCHGEERLD